jgi:hypothetical protein
MNWALVCIGEPAFIALDLSGHRAKTFGEIMKIAALSVPVMIAGSIIAGISNSMNFSTAPVWRTETSNAGERHNLASSSSPVISHIADALCLNSHTWALVFSTAHLMASPICVPAHLHHGFVRHSWLGFLNPLPGSLHTVM